MRTDTEMPRLFRIRPMEATVIPLPTELTTPPVTKISLVTGAPYPANGFGLLTDAELPYVASVLR